MAWVAVLTGGACLPMIAEEGSAQRLEAAQREPYEASWPRKPDNRLSPLSGKMKQVATVSPRLYGSGRELPTTKLDSLQKESRLARSPGWDAPEGARWEQARWQAKSEAASGKKLNQRFESVAEWGGTKSFTAEELPRKRAPDWMSRASDRELGADGSLRRYEGRLTRVREQVWQEEEKARDLGPGRQEKFRPNEVERILAEPIGPTRAAVRGQSRAASPPAVGDN